MLVAKFMTHATWCLFFILRFWLHDLFFIQELDVVSESKMWNLYHDMQIMQNQ
jgi:hypothetical protein